MELVQNAQEKCDKIARPGGSKEQQRLPDHQSRLGALLGDGFFDPIGSLWRPFLLQESVHQVPLYQLIPAEFPGSHYS